MTPDDTTIPNSEFVDPAVDATVDIGEDPNPHVIDFSGALHAICDALEKMSDGGVAHLIAKARREASKLEQAMKAAIDDFEGRAAPDLTAHAEPGDTILDSPSLSMNSDEPVTFGTAPTGEIEPRELAPGENLAEGEVPAGLSGEPITLPPAGDEPPVPGASDTAEPSPAFDSVADANSTTLAGATGDPANNAPEPVLGDATPPEGDPSGTTEPSKPGDSPEPPQAPDDGTAHMDSVPPIVGEPGPEALTPPEGLAPSENISPASEDSAPPDSAG